MITVTISNLPRLLRPRPYRLDVYMRGYTFQMACPSVLSCAGLFAAFPSYFVTLLRSFPLTEMLWIICYSISVCWVSFIVGLSVADYLIERFHL